LKLDAVKCLPCHTPSFSIEAPHPALAQSAYATANLQQIVGVVEGKIFWKPSYTVPAQYGVSMGFLSPVVSIVSLTYINSRSFYDSQ
jgi:hypothetical protein